MKSKDLRSMALIVTLGAALFAAGCSSNNEPCNTDPSQIESARAELRTAEDAVVSARAELSQASEQKTQLQNRLDSLPDVGELEQRLETLKKGSGR